MMSWAPAARAQSLAELEQTAAQLASEQHATRQAAIDRLKSLGAEWAPFVRERASAHTRIREPEITITRAFASFRHVAGSRRADDRVDLEAAVPLRLDASREPLAVSIAERILLIRAMARAGGEEAGRALVALAELDAGSWRWELRAIVDDIGPRILPALLAARTSRVHGIRSWASWGFETLHMDAPGTAVQQRRGEDVAMVLRAYGELREMDAMPVIVSLVDDSREQVRTAARAAIVAYGVNARWQLRIAYELALGDDAPSGWDHRQLASALFAALDEDREEAARAHVDAAGAALTRGDHHAARVELDAALRSSPSLHNDTLRAGYAAIAGDDLALARRALRTSPGKRHAADAARVERLRAERWLAGGIVDIDGYARAADLDPTDPIAASRLDAFSGPGVPTRWLAIAGAMLLALVALGLLRRRPTESKEGAAMLATPSSE